MVDEQGTLIDSLEDYVDDTVEFTEAAGNEMRGAVTNRKNRRKVSLV